MSIGLFTEFSIPKEKADEHLPAYEPKDERATRKEYQLNFLEWIYRRGTQILLYSAIVSSDTLIYTVPKGYILYLTSVYTTASIGSATGSGSYWHRITIKPTIFMLSRIAHTTGTVSTGTFHKNFNPPFIIREGQQIWHGNEVHYISTSIIGYLMPKLSDF